MKLIDLIIKKINSDQRFVFLGRGNNNGVWQTESFLDLKKNIAKKGIAKVRIFLFQQTKDGLEFKIEMQIISVYEWESMFEGFVENEDEFNLIMRCLGIN